MHEPRSFMTILWSAVWLTLAVLIVGSLLVSFVSANWGWLLLVAAIVIGVAVLVAWLRRRTDRW